MAIASVAGLVADRAVGDPRRGHPVAAFGAAAEKLESVAYRPSRAAGAAYAAGLVCSSASVAALADRMLRRAPRCRTFFATAVMWSVLGGRSLERHARDLASAVRRDDLDGARALAPALVGRDPADLDATELCRAAVESVAENTADAVVGPLVWAALAGPAGAVAYRAANTLDAMVGHRSARYESFGWAAARLDDVLTWFPARTAALLAVALAPCADGDVGRAAVTLWRDGRRHPSPNAGRLESVFAGVLGVSLGGRNVYGGKVHDRPRLGDGPPPGPDDVERAVRLSGLVGWAAAGLCALVAGRCRP